MVETVEDPKYKSCQRWLKGQFSAYEFTNDARFESFRAYPRKRQIFKKHRDYALDYEKKTKLYRSYQRWYCTEINRQIHCVEARFSKLIHDTLKSNQHVSRGLQYSYNKWKSIHSLPMAESHAGPQVAAPVLTKHQDNLEDEELPNIPQDANDESRQRRRHSLRSASVDNIPHVETATALRQPYVFNDMKVKSVSNLTHSEIRNITRTRGNCV
ncbi:uncharacterized protein LOC127861949 isoform X2 [Dreissena polymorpha]|uniref:uncharacterized protein LOC127861949 isoform X2 n=1 Tax=Dreissena polymorpha TaxID=45954 RepID=UPI0022654230|nr:uncharacterized protein LOC127861949 isoform X2 [Dreissena polymorpha]